MGCNFNKPLKFKNPEELQKKIDKYFTDCDKEHDYNLLIYSRYYLLCESEI